MIPTAGIYAATLYLIKAGYWFNLMMNTVAYIGAITT